VTSGVTPSQTVGPFWSIGLPWDAASAFTGAAPADAITVSGYVLDGAGDPVGDAIVETWQADPEGRFDHPDDPRGAVAWNGFRGFARSCVDADGRYEIVTVMPGPIPAADGDGLQAGGGLQAPHLLVSVFARGLLDRVVTRISFADQEALNAADPILAALPAERRATLLAQPDGDRGYRLDIHLQGPRETVFFAL
jgi:protocatechuate 3,4-dioxygenase alpha subunit